MALARVWKGQRFSWWMTTLLHRYPESSAFERGLQDTDLAYLFSSSKALGSLAENYVGLPFQCARFAARGAGACHSAAACDPHDAGFLPGGRAGRVS
jgi:hypothetical protein